MKVLFFFTVNKGLLSQYFSSLAKHLSENGFEVIVYSQKSNSKVWKENNVTYKVETKKGVIANYWNTCSVIKEEQPQIIITNFNYVNPSILFAKLFRVQRIITWQHTSIKHNQSSKKQIAVKQYFLKRADVVIVNSEILRNEMTSVFNINPEKIEKLPFWTDIANKQEKPIPQLDKNYINIGCPGRLLQDKNQRILIEIFAKLKVDLPGKKLKLVFAGSGPDKDYLIKRADELGLSRDVLFLGVLSPEEMLFFYRNIHLAVFPSKHEAFGLVLIEAMVTGTLFLVSKNFGALDFIPTRGISEKLIFNPDNPAELKQKIKECVISNEFCYSNFKNLYSQTFSEQKIKQKFYNIVKAKL